MVIAPLLALGAAVLFGLSAPAAKVLVGAVDPWLSAGLQIAALKGLVAGTANVAIALARGAAGPPVEAVLGAAAVGLLGYGTSLVLFVFALRHPGTSRTGAHFSTAPFIGAVGAVLALREAVTPSLAAAAGLMALGVWLHLTEQHDHEHVHEPLEHEHAHRHDEHHRHEHPAGMVVTEPHTHRHVHAPLRHRHPHHPDLHHRHEHPPAAR